MIQMFDALPDNSSSHDDDNGLIRIACVTSRATASFNDVQTGFINSFTQHVEDHLDKLVTQRTFVCSGSESELFKSFEEIARHNYQLVLCFGHDTARVARYLCSEGGLRSLVVHVDVNNPQGTSISKSDESSLSNFVHVANAADSYAGRINHLLKIKGDMHRAIIIHDAETSRIEPQARIEAVAQTLYEKGIKALIYDYKELRSSNIIRSVDILLALRQTRVQNALPKLAEFSARYHMPLISSELTSIQRGASLACGQDDIDFGKKTGTFSFQAFSRGHTECLHPIEFVNEPLRLAVSPSNMRTQGLNLDKLAIEYLREKRAEGAYAL